MAYSGKIYKIFVKDCEESPVYYGSTKQSLVARFQRHAQIYSQFKVTQIQRRNGTSSIEVFKYADEHGKTVTIELVEELQNISKQELLMRETHYIVNFPCVNRVRAFMTEEEEKEMKAKWYQERKNEIYAKQKQDRQVHPEKDEIYRQQVKEWRQAHQEKMREFRNKYLESDKGQAHVAKMKETINCPCGISYQRVKQSRHMKTQTHVKYLAEQNS